MAYAERLGRLETSVETLHESIDGLQRAIASLEAKIGLSGQTNWGVVVSLGMVLVSLWAATINPLKQELDRREPIFVEHDSRLKVIETLISRNTLRIDLLDQQLTDIRDHGSPITDKRLTLIESYMQARK
jgi:predicted  nucleic acid-binding Zn-ribbon protein